MRSVNGFLMFKAVIILATLFPANCNISFYYLQYCIYFSLLLYFLFINHYIFIKNFFSEHVYALKNPTIVHLHENSVNTKKNNTQA